MLLNEHFSHLRLSSPGPNYRWTVAATFFFYKYIQKAQWGATHSTQDVYMKPLIQRKKRTPIYKFKIRTLMQPFKAIQD